MRKYANVEAKQIIELLQEKKVMASFHHSQNRCHCHLQPQTHQ